MTWTSQKNSTNIKICFSRDRTITVPYDEELVMFLDTIKPHTADSSDIRIMQYYFNIMWPIHVSGKTTTPHTFTNYLKETNR